MFIRDIMTKGVITVDPKQPIADALAIMLDEQISFIVVAANNKPIGVLTEGDIVALAEANDDAARQHVSQFMSSPVVTVKADANVFHAYDEILEHHIRYIVVVDHAGDLIGVITMSNFLASMGVEHLARLRHVSEEASTKIETVSPDTPMVDVIATMYRCRHAIIALEDDRPVGLVTSRDIARIYSQGRSSFTKKTMRDYMRTAMVTLPKFAYIPEANNLMRSCHTRHIVVLNDDQSLFGLLTISDVVRSMESKYMAFMKAVMHEMERDLKIRSVQKTALFERNPNAVFSLDKKLNILSINPASVLLTGLNEDALLGTAMIDLLDQKDHENFIKASANAILGEACSMDATIRGKDDEAAFAFLNLVPVIVDDDHPGLYVVAHDVTERTIAERHLRLLSSALEQANESILIINESGAIEFANRSFSRCFVGDNEDLRGKHCDDLLTCNVFGSTSELWKVLKKEGSKQYNDMEIRLRNGTVLDAKLS
ncbi:MAG: CBS domain-containing protein, partial [Mariprofundaceae bacterium]|nr:CBS domain-containing protein [Mariprofundaceae bacterium]